MKYDAISPVKINLTLHILNRQQNGYHDIYSLFWKKKGIEGLTISTVYGENIRDELTVHNVDILGKNLITKTLEFVRDCGFCVPSLKIDLYKKIPLMSGIGAGSGNAVALLSWLESSYGIKLSNEEQLHIGSDIPFMFGDSPLAIVRGLGDRLSNVDGSLNLIAGIVFPNWFSSTPEAYRLLDQLRKSDSTVFSEDDLAKEATFVLDKLRNKERIGLLPNDFYAVSKQDHPEYEYAFKEAERMDLLAWGLCGCGSAFFVLSDNLEQIKEFCTHLGKEKWVKQINIME